MAIEKSARRPGQSGFAALALVSVLLLTGVAAVSMGLLRDWQDDAAVTVAEGLAAGRQAGRAVLFFAGAFGRLPCAATDVGGLENCAAHGAGWLPAASLGLADVAVDGRHGAAEAAAPVAYVLYRSPVATSRIADPLPASGSGTAEGLDFCAAMDGAGLAGTVDGSALPSDATAYSIAVDTARILGASSGVSGGSTHKTSRHALHKAFECASIQASIDTLSAAAGLTSDALKLREGNQKKAADLTNTMRMLLLHRSLEVDLAQFDLAAGIYTLTDNAAKLQAALDAALAGFPPPPEAIPGFIAGIASANMALALNAIDIPRSVVSLGLDSATLRRYQKASGEALATPVWQAGNGIVAQARHAGLGTERTLGLAAGGQSR